MRKLVYHWIGSYPCTAKEELKSRFTFLPAGPGHYKVTYTSSSGRQSFTITTCNMSLIDATKNCDEPKWSDLTHLRNLCVKMGARKLNVLK